MRAIGYWLMGMGFVGVGHLLDRLLVGMVPKKYHWLDPPIWTIGLLAASLLVHWAAGRGVRDARPAARGTAVVLIVAWMLASLVSLNTESLDVHRDGHGLAALGGLMRAGGWPAMLGHLSDFAWAPTGRWGLPEFFGAAATVGMGLWMIGVLIRGPAAPAAEGEPQANAVRRRLAGIRADANRPVSARILSAAIACHLAMSAILVIVSLVGLTWRVAGHPL